MAAQPDPVAEFRPGTPANVMPFQQRGQKKITVCRQKWKKVYHCDGIICQSHQDDHMGNRGGEVHKAQQNHTNRCEGQVPINTCTPDFHSLRRGQRVKTTNAEVNHGDQAQVKGCLETLSDEFVVRSDKAMSKFMKEK